MAIIDEIKVLNPTSYRRIVQQQASQILAIFSLVLLASIFMVTVNVDSIYVTGQLFNSSESSGSTTTDFGLSLPSVSLATNNNDINENVTDASNIPDAESIFKTETAKMPISVGSFIILIPNEAHESWQDERHKLITDHNPYFIPANLVVPQGTEIILLNADAPWDTPHPHTIEIIDKANDDVVYASKILDYGNRSDAIKNLLPGNYSIITDEYDAREGTIFVESDQQSTGTLTVGGFYTATNQVENNRDNDGNPHPGSLQYYREQFGNNGFDILSEYNFTYTQCDYCPGGYWIDNKTGEHTLLIFATAQPVSEALEKLEKLVKDNVYV